MIDDRSPRLRLFVLAVSIAMALLLWIAAYESGDMLNRAIAAAVGLLLVRSS